MKNCLDTGTIQAFLDGELMPAEASTVSAHIAICDACASLLATAEEESAFVFSVLGREMDALVPTQRLWNKINGSIEVEKQNAPFWEKAWASIAVLLATPSIAVATAILVVAGLFAIVFLEKNGVEDSRGIAKAPTSHSVPVLDRTEPSNGDPVGTSRSTTLAANPKTELKPTYAVASYTAPKRSNNGAAAPRPVTDVQQAAYIPGEESYVKTIASLSETVNQQKDAVLRPSERVSYERDMAVVNDAIKKMRDEVRKNPRNESAKQVLYTSYQNKIDLLNSVSQREELVASLK
ncbi:MAG TPA: zf-HC2 domain-containing protein [Pyrinomonadaceae bacterium]|nr:zf-HC2 domain-containing protein [Pyrinomonadaceae bacterium]